MEQLSSTMIDAGATLVRHLEREGIRLSAALWSFDAETGRWSLVLGSPDVRTAGPLALYRKAGQQLARMGDPEEVPVYRLEFVDPRSSLTPLPTGSAGMGRGASGRRVTGATIGGVYLEDAYVYKLAARARRVAA